MRPVDRVRQVLHQAGQMCQNEKYQEAEEEFRRQQIQEIVFRRQYIKRKSGDSEQGESEESKGKKNKTGKEESQGVMRRIDD